ncbi:hypothetical protein VKS41_003325 [Umbelopsis sp. WA50703]
MSSESASRAEDRLKRLLEQYREICLTENVPDQGLSVNLVTAGAGGGAYIQDEDDDTSPQRTEDYTLDEWSTGVQEHRNIVAREPRRIREDPVAFMMNGWRGYHNYIGSKFYYKGFSEEMKNKVLSSQEVQHAIDLLAERQAHLFVDTKQTGSASADKKKVANLRRKRKQFKLELEAVATAIANKCFSRMDDIRLLRFFAFTINNILVRLYHQGIHIKESEWLELRRVALIAEQKKQSLILLPCHKSHIDYLVVSYVMFRLGLQIPHIVAGDNLDMPVVGTLLRGCGAFFIRREWGDDLLYKTVVEEYIATLLAGGYNLECFVEGTRSRLGKLLTPKFGILKIVLDAMLSGKATDCMMVPISIGYDKIIETSNYANELLGTPKEKESLWGLFSSSRLLQLKWGRVDIRVSKPFSLRDWVDQQVNTRQNFDVSLPDNKVVLLKSLGYKVLADINAISVVMPSALVGTVILTLRGRGVGRNELIRRVEWLRRIIINKGGKVAEFGNMPTGVIVDRATSILKDLIGERNAKEVIEPTFYGIKRFELSYYRNQVIHLFVEESIVCVALYTVIKRGGAKLQQRMQFDKLLDEIAFISSLFKLDMIFKQGGVESNTLRTIRWLAENNVIEVTDDGWVGLTDAERDCGRENYDFLCFLIWPFVESYWLASVSLLALTPSKDTNIDEPQWIDEKIFSNRTQNLGKTLYYQGDLSYLEAVNKETVKNAFSRYIEQNILLNRRFKTGKVTSEVALHPDYVPVRGPDGAILPQGRLWGLVERIGNFRREGKNRRDNATVSARTLRLADMVGQDNLPSIQEQKKRSKAEAASVGARL